MQSCSASRPARPMAEKLRELELQLGYAVCGINGCCLPNLHVGDCVFEFAGSKRERRTRLPAP
ncbi:hypothetical protein, partial [Klebsiella pneumoniae]|uniref:hypothetical protein n=1 Tax=Klebsiella pneumoniae TaxID=573 RepID=UPI0025A1BB5F